MTELVELHLEAEEIESSLREHEWAIGNVDCDWVNEQDAINELWSRRNEVDARLAEYELDAPYWQEELDAVKARLAETGENPDGASSQQSDE